MKKILYNSIAAALSLIVIVSCENVLDRYQGQEYTTLSVMVSADPTTKTFFSSGEEEIKWSTNDVISLIDDEGLIHHSEPLSTSVVGEVSFTFNNWPVGNTPVYAIHSGAYGTASDDTYADELIHTSVETEQVLTKDKTGRYSREAIVCVGNVIKTEGNYSVSLKHICGLVKVTLTSDMKYSALKLEGTGTDDTLAGSITITPGETPAFSVVEGTKVVTIVEDTNGLRAGTHFFCVLPGTITSPKVTFVEKVGGAETTIQRSGDIEITAGTIADLGSLENVTDQSVDLSEKETANCYIINASGTYRFKAVQGNSTISVGDVASVEILWSEQESTGTASLNAVISSVEYNNGYIRFSTVEDYQYGNSLIAAKDADGNILWSWHIWATNKNGYPSDVTYPSGVVLMDRNIGARTVGRSHSLLYQWGRKDPFMGSVGKGSFVVADFSDAEYYDDSTSGKAIYAKKRINDINTSVQNPTTIYGNTELSMWVSGQTTANLWGVGTDKTMYDPCPAGYRVPATLEFLTGQTFEWSYDSTNRLFTVSDEEGFECQFTSSAYIGMDDAENNIYNPQHNTGASYLWTSTRTAARTASAIHITESSRTYDSQNKNNAYAVRCEKIQ